MRRLIPILIGCLSAWSPSPEGLMAQQTQSAAELALESLLEMPVSTAAKYEQRQTEAPAFVTIITRDEIRTFGYRTLEDVLWNQTGFYAGNDRQYSEVGFRGVGRSGYYNNKLLVLVDGHSVSDPFSGGSRIGGAQSIDLENVERIELVRGPGSTLYGARAMLAVVNLVTRKGRDLDGLELNADLGSFGAHGASARYGTVLGPKADLAFAVSWASSEGEDLYFPELDNPVLNGGRAQDLDWERRGRALLTLRFEDFFLQASAAERRKGIPTAVYKSAFNHPDAESTDGSLFLEGRYVRGLGPATELTLRGYADSYDNKGVYPFSADPDESNAARNSLERRAVGAEVRIRWDPSFSQRLVIGVEGNRVFRASSEFDGIPDAYRGGDFPFWILSGFLQHEMQLTERLVLTAGIRRDEYSTQGSATTPRAALVFHAGESTSFKVLAGDAFRAPNTLELFVTQPSGALLANSALDPERIRSFEGIWQQRIGPVATTVSIYHNEIRDLVDLVQVPMPDSLRAYGTLIFQQQNVDNVRAQGMDLEARAALPGGIISRIGYGFSRAFDRDTGARVVNSPKHQLRLSASSEWWGWGTFGVAARAESGRRTLFGQETDPMTVFDFTATSRPFMDHLTVQLLARNLFDAAYPLPSGSQHVQAMIPQPSRSLSLRAELRW